VLSLREIASSVSSSSVATGRLDIASLICPAALENYINIRKENNEQQIENPHGPRYSK